MDAPVTIAIRELLERYLTGLESLDTVVPQFVSLFGQYLEAALEAEARGEPALGDFEPHNLTPDQERLMRALHLAVVDFLPPPPIEYLPVEDDGAA